MLSMLKSWKGRVEIDGKQYENIEAFISSGSALSQTVNIKLLSDKIERTVSEPAQSSKQKIQNVAVDTVYRITVKQYMTKQSEPGFDFMLKWNNDNPMPLRTMEGTVLQETKGMVKMHLRGFGQATCNCMRCGRDLKNPVSRYYGIGPECMQKLGLVRAIEDIEGIKEDLVQIEWEGWIIKSAITEKEIIE